MKKLLNIFTVILLTILILAIPANAMITIQYTPLDVPNIDSSFKTYMDYHSITNRSSAQYKLISEWGWCDNQGFMRVNGEIDLGITDHYYMIALGSFYGTTMGTKYRITTDTGNVFYGILSDAKDNKHTNWTNQYSYNKDIVEFLVYTPSLNKSVKKMGSANVYMPLNGVIAKIERIDFIEIPEDQTVENVETIVEEKIETDIMEENLYYENN